VLPVVLVFVGLAVVFVVEAWAHHSPWIYYDELHYTWNSRAIADLGVAPGAKSWSFVGLYPFVIAPAWLLHDVHAAYFTAKLIGAVTMAAVVFPAYLLARSLVAERRVALVAAAATAAVPAMSYSSSLMTETLAYPYATLCFFLIVRALTVRSRGWLGAAAVASLLTPLVRQELAVIPIAFALAAAVLVATSSWLRRRWSVRMRSAAAAALCICVAAAAWLLTLVSAAWSTAVHHPVAMVQTARSAAGALAVGVGILPAVAAVAAFGGRGREDQPPPTVRPFLALFGSAAFAFLLYTATKRIYFGTVFGPGNFVPERNVIYLAPLVFAAAALLLSRLRAHPLVLAGAALLVGWTVATVPLLFLPYPAQDAPSLEVLWPLHDRLGLSSAAVHALLVAAVAVSLVVLLALATKNRLAVLGAVAVVVLCFVLAAEIYTSRRTAGYAQGLAASVPRPLDWIDRATGGASAIYVGQRILQPSDIWTQAFWNRSLVRLRSLDDTPGGRGQRGIKATGDILRISVSKYGALAAPRGTRFLVAEEGITGDGDPVTRAGRWRIYRGTRLESAALGLYSDRWMGARSSFRVFKPLAGKVRVDLSRKPGWCGKDVPGRARLTVNGKPWDEGIVHACRTIVLSSPILLTPYEAVVTIEPTFSPATLDPQSFSDARQLGAQVRYRFTSGAVP